MRIWSIHPKYLDAKGIVALWRETLLAKNVLEGKTIGYRNHPQLLRFKNSEKPLEAINQYLEAVYNESKIRKYNFDITKFNPTEKKIKLRVTQGQINYEYEHLLHKLKTRDPMLYEKLKKNKIIEPHPIFKIVKGDVEKWEIIK